MRLTSTEKAKAFLKAFHTVPVVCAYCKDEFWSPFDKLFIRDYRRCTKCYGVLRGDEALKAVSDKIFDLINTIYGQPEIGNQTCGSGVESCDQDT